MKSRLANVLDKIKRANPDSSRMVRLVAVSKTKPLEDVIEAYQCGQRHFGENYIAELNDKSHDPRILEQCPDIKWHFIGNLQSNKAKILANCPNLDTVETIHSSSIADKLNKEREKISASIDLLRVFIQVKTAVDEETKGGCSTDEVCDIAQFIREKCPKLKLSGLMTIGNLNASINSTSLDTNPDFESLIECKKKVCERFNNDENSKNLELSMGVSFFFLMS